MEARTAKKKWQWDDTKWIITLLITLVLMIAGLTASVTSRNYKIDKIWKEYITINQVVNIAEMIQNERMELVGIATRDSVKVQECIRKYNDLIMDWNRDLNATRSLNKFDGSSQ